MRRILITGSRDWPSYHLVMDILEGEVTRHPEGVVVVHGGARGADSYAAQWCRYQPISATRVVEEEHPVNWRPHGIYNPQAGLVRNQEMVDAGADICYAFLYRGSRGATHCADAAAAAHIPVVRIEVA